MKIRLRPATAHDVGAYIRIARGVASPINLTINDPAEVLAEINSADVFMIERGTQIVGYISYEERSSTHAYISELAIHPDFQGSGMGSQALGTLLMDLGRAGYSHIELVTHPDNPAKRLYERHGFTVTGRIEDYEDSHTPRLILSRRI